MPTMPNYAHKVGGSIPYNDRLYARLLDAQRQILIDFITTDKANPLPMHDDGGDYVMGAINLFHDLYEVMWQNIDPDLDRWHLLINTPGHLLRNYGCDGIASAFYELNCLSIQDPDDFPHPTTHPSN